MATLLNMQVLSNVLRLLYMYVLAACSAVSRHAVTTQLAPRICWQVEELRPELQLDAFACAKRLTGTQAC